MAFLKTLVDGNERDVARLRRTARAVNEFDAAFSALPDAELQAKTAEFKNRLEQGESLDAMLPEIFAVVREAGKRTLGMRHFDVQIMGGQVLFEGRIAEMKTGEGKTLVATLPVYARALEGRGVHLVTVNDYLARRDAEWMGPIYQFLGLSVGVIQHGLEPGRAACGVQLRRHLRHQQRGRLRLSARQHGVAGRRFGAARAVLRARRRSRLDSRRRSAYAADHQRSVARGDGALREVRADHSAAEEGRRLHGRREGARRSDHRSRRRPRREDARHLKSVRAAQHRADASAQRRAQGLEPLPPRSAVHREGWRGRSSSTSSPGG